MALVVFLQEDEDVLSVYRNLKIFCETAPRALAKISLASLARVERRFQFTLALNDRAMV